MRRTEGEEVTVTSVFEKEAGEDILFKVVLFGLRLRGAKVASRWPGIGLLLKLIGVLGRNSGT